MNGIRSGSTKGSVRSLRATPQLFIILSVCTGAVANVLLQWLNELVRSPFYFDSIGTASIALLFGPLPGIATATLTHVLMELVRGFPMLYLPWALCNISTGVIVGWMSERGLFERFMFIFAAGSVVTVANAVIGAAIGTFLYGGSTTHFSDFLILDYLEAFGESLLTASFLMRLPTNFVDKTIAVLTAYMIYEIIQLTRRAEVDAAPSDSPTPESSSTDSSSTDSGTPGT